MAFQALPQTVDTPSDLWTALTAAHDRLNAIEYSAAPAPSQAEVSAFWSRVNAG